MNDTRDRILEAALACFLEEGYEQATIARIRERSHVSNGALFHHFRSKEAIADALYVAAISSFHAGLWELVRRRPRSLRAAVRGTISHQLRWTEEHADLARFVYARGHLDWDSAAGAQVSALNRELAAAFGDWMAPLAASGEIRIGSMLMITAVVSGPAHAIARRWLAGQLDRSPSEFVDELAEAAWAGLRGKPVPARAGPREPVAAPAGRREPVLAPAGWRQRARVGRVTLELVADDGVVVAHAHADAELVPVRSAGA